MSQILIYQSEDGRTKLDVRLEGQTVWLSQKQLTELFGKAKGTISEHIKHIFEDEELEPEATVRQFRTVQTEGSREVTREVEHYNLDMVLALGFRVRSPMAVRFRQWAADIRKKMRAGCPRSLYKRRLALRSTIHDLRSTITLNPSRSFAVQSSF